MNAPAYQGIKDFILARIHAGEWSEGDQVPSENELAREFKVARMTVNRALRELTTEQVLTRVQGAGTFVARPKYESTLVAIRSISDEILARGHRYRAEVLDIGVLPADEPLAVEMGLAAHDKVFNSRVLHFENDEPVQLEERWVNPAIAPDSAWQDFTHITPNQYLVRVAPLQAVEYRIEALAPDADTRARLAMGEAEPCLVLHRRTRSRGLVASVANLWHPGSRYRFAGHFQGAPYAAASGPLHPPFPRVSPSFGRHMSCSFLDPAPGARRWGRSGRQTALQPPQPVSLAGEANEGGAPPWTMPTPRSCRCGGPIWCCSRARSAPPRGSRA